MGGLINDLEKFLKIAEINEGGRIALKELTAKFPRSVMDDLLGKLEKLGCILKKKGLYLYIEHIPEVFRYRFLDLVGSSLFKRIYVFREVGSTNDMAYDICKHEGDDFILVAASQTAGRGRQGRVWYSPEGGLWFTLAVKRSTLGGFGTAALNMALALCAAKSIEKVCPRVRISIKWPNDIMIGNKKTGGILIEDRRSIKHLICGIGINTGVSRFPKKLNAVSVNREAKGCKADNVRILKQFIRNFEKMLRDRTVTESMRSEWSRRSVMKGRIVTVRRGVRTASGRLSGFSPDGGMLLRTSRGAIEKVLSGEVISYE